MKIDEYRDAIEGLYISRGEIYELLEIVKLAKGLKLIVEEGVFRGEARQRYVDISERMYEKVRELEERPRRTEKW